MKLERFCALEKGFDRQEKRQDFVAYLSDPQETIIQPRERICIAFSGEKGH